MNDYPTIQQFRIWSPEKNDFVYSGGTPMMLSGFFEQTATLYTVHKIPYQRNTNLVDHEGKEVYEGDIVDVFLAAEYQDFENEEEDDGFNKRNAFVCRQEVKWNENSGYFCDEDTGEYCPALGDVDDIVVKVIGNIHEHPSLLKS